MEANRSFAEKNIKDQGSLKYCFVCRCVCVCTCDYRGIFCVRECTLASLHDRKWDVNTKLKIKTRTFYKDYFPFFFPPPKLPPSSCNYAFYLALAENQFCVSVHTVALSCLSFHKELCWKDKREDQISRVWGKTEASWNVRPQLSLPVCPGREILAAGLGTQTMPPHTGRRPQAIRKPFSQNMDLYGEDEEKVVKDCPRL